MGFVYSQKDLFMKVHITINKKVTGRRLHALLLLLTTTLMSFAQNVTVSIADFEIAPGEQKTVDILVTNDIAYGTDFGGDIYLPEGLKVIPNEDGDYLTRNMTRCTTTHALTTATKAENAALAEGQIRFTLVSQSAKTLKGNKGAVLSFTVEATDALAEDSKIALKDAFITNTSASHVKADCEANVHNANYVSPELTLTAQDFVLTPSKEVNVSFAFATNIEVSAFQADITLPEGLEFVTNEEGDYATFNMARLTSSHTPGFYLNGNKLNIQLSSSKSSNLKGEDGELFSVTLRATTDLAAESVITINRVIASTRAGKRQDIPAIEVKVSNPDVAAKAAADEAVKALFVSMNQLASAVAAYAETVQAQFKTQLDETAAACTAVEEALATDWLNGDVAANADARNVKIASLQETIAQIAADAAAAQKAYEEANSKKLGDIDENGKVDIDDLSLIRDMILEKIADEELTEEMKKAADLNGDGKVSVVDLVIINNVIVFNNPDGPVANSLMSARSTAMNPGYLDMQMSADRLGIALNSDMAFAAIQMDVMLPAGVSLSDVTFAGASEKVIVASNSLNNGACRIVMYTSDNSSILLGATQLLELYIAGEGSGDITVDNIFAATAKGEGYQLAAVSGNHTISTAISGVETYGDSKYAVCGINGVKSNTLKKGVNIVRDNNGNVKKIQVK